VIADGQLGLLGLGVRAGSVVVGTGGVRSALQRGDLVLVVVAADCSARTQAKVVRLAEAKGVRTLTGPAAGVLGRRLGRGAVQAVGVRDARLAAGIAPERGPAQSRRT
jgi:ribosomal protein L7Ae-like RNA K-turn-binding protein